MTARILGLWLCCAAFAHAAPNAVIIAGSGGEEEYQSRFLEWGQRLRTALVETSGFLPERVQLLVEPDAEGIVPEGSAPSTIESIRAVFSALASRAGKEDDLFAFLIGHGSFQRREAKLNIPGPDLSAEELGALIGAVPARNAVIVNAASASAPFINALSGPGRIILTATKDAEQRNATQFMEFFIQALTDGSADRDRDERITVLELGRQAAALTGAWYTARGLIATEHALFDDNGDGLGSRLVADEPEEQPDGALAAQCHIRDYVFPPGVPPDLISSYREAQEAIARHKSLKPQLPEGQYLAELEVLLVNAARINRELKHASASDPGAPQDARAFDKP